MNAPGHYRKRPVVVEAMPWDGTLLQALQVQAWLLGHSAVARVALAPVEVLPERGSAGDDEVIRPERGATLTIPTLEGEMRAAPGDWIIRGVSGEFYPCKREIFEATYEAVESLTPGVPPFQPLTPLTPLTPYFPPWTVPQAPLWDNGRVTGLALVRDDAPVTASEGEE